MTTTTIDYLLWKDYFLFFFFLVHLWIFYGWYIFPLTSKASVKCAGSWSCFRRLSHTTTTTTTTIASIWSTNSISTTLLSLLGYGNEDYVDLSDGQWKDLRQHLNLFILVVITSVIIDRIYLLILDNLLMPSYSTRKSYRLLGKLSIGIISIFIQHGFHSLIIFGLAWGGYYAPRLFYQYPHHHHVGPCNSVWSKCMVWIMGLFVLVFKESYRLLPYLPSSLSFLYILFDHRYGGLYRWQLPANFLALRILSYGLDCLSGWPVGEEKDHEDFISYLTYIVYAPLYIAGPIMPYKDFLHQAFHPQPITLNTCFYALRWIFCFLLMEVFLRKYYVFAIASSGLLQHLHVYEQAAVCYLLLKAMWLKFLLIWRFFRAWALFDGICPPENMLRCMSNNYSLEQFWKGWHASFNQWLVRYIYKPMGGNRTGWRYFAVFLIFLFVAFWHDCEYRLLIWGGLNAFFYGLEIVLKPYAGYHKAEQLVRQTFAESLLSSLVSAFYIIVLILVNLIGYGAGTGGFSNLMTRVFTAEAGRTLLFTVYMLTVGVQIMFFLQRKGLVKDFR